MASTLLYVSTSMAGAVALAAAYIHFTSPKDKDYADSDVMPEKRAIRFEFEGSDISTWNRYGRFVSIFMNSLSIFFPVGEAFFVRSVQAHRDAAGVKDDEKLRKQVNAFIAQESIHGREHDRYNDVIKAKYPCNKLIERAAGAVLHGVEHGLGTRMALATTVALEHWTGLMGGSLLECPSIYGGESKIGLVWHWHAMEETEHKAVAYDVYSRAYGFNLVSWAEKALALVVGSIILWTLVWAGFIMSIAIEGSLFNISEWIILLRVCFGFSYDGKPVGVLRRCTLPLFDYFHPAFHPWKWSPAGEQEKLQQSLDDFQQELEKYHGDKDSNLKRPEAVDSGDKQKNESTNAVKAKHQEADNKPQQAVKA